MKSNTGNVYSLFYAMSKNDYSHPHTHNLLDYSYIAPQTHNMDNTQDYQNKLLAEIMQHLGLDEDAVKPDEKKWSLSAELIKQQRQEQEMWAKYIDGLRGVPHMSPITTHTVINDTE